MATHTLDREAFAKRIAAGETGFGGWTLQGLTFSRSELEGLDLTFCTFESCEFDDHENVDFSESHFVRCNFVESTLRKCKFRGCTLVECNFERGELADVTCAGVKAVDCKFDSAQLRNVAFDTAVLTRTRFVGAKCESVTFVSAQLDQVNFSDVHMREGAFTNASIVPATFSRSRLERVNFVGISQISGIDFELVKLFDCLLIGAQLQDANLGLADLRGSNLLGADLTGADLRGVTNIEFDATILRDARLSYNLGDRWTKLRRSFFGTSAFFHRAMVVAFCLVYVIQFLFWVG